MRKNLKLGNQVETDVPELGGTMFTELKERIKFNLLVVAFRRRPLLYMVFTHRFRKVEKCRDGYILNKKR